MEVAFVKGGGNEKESMSHGRSVMAYCFVLMRLKLSQIKYTRSTFERGPHLVEASFPKTKNFIENEPFVTL